VSDPRVVLGAALGSRTGIATAAFARVLSGDGAGSVPPCWGDLAEHFDAILTTDEARIDAFEALRAAGDLGALLLFLDLNRARTGVLAHVWTVARTLPATIQCAFVSLLEWSNVAPELAAGLHPAARRLLIDPEARVRDHEHYAAHAAALRALRTRLPQVTESASVARTP
jgi:hypothetical protein